MIAVEGVAEDTIAPQDSYSCHRVCHKACHLFERLREGGFPKKEGIQIVYL